MVKTIFLMLGAFLAPFLSADTPSKLSVFATTYPDKFKGQTTSSGEVYQPNQFTASYSELPFHTLIKVSNPSNGLWAIVRINDRPESSKSNQIELSRAASAKMDLLKKAISPVEIEVLGISQIGINPSQMKINEVAKLESSSSKPNAEKKPLPSFESELIPPTNLNLVLQNGFTQSENLRFSDLSGKRVFPKGFGIQIGAFMNDENAVRYGEWASKKGFTGILIENSKINGFPIYRVIVGEYKKEEEADSKMIELARAGFPSAVLYTFTEN